MEKSALHTALFLDFENLYATLKNRLDQGKGDYGPSPTINFESLVEYIQNKYGRLDQKDFVVAANFAHYNQQLGGLNRLARIVDVDSFEPRQVRSLAQSSPGKRHVIGNYSDMTLAFLAGVHVASNPADIYIFVTGDKAFAAVATQIRDEYLKRVLFLFPDPASAGVILSEKFIWAAFEETQPQKATEDNTIAAADEEAETEKQGDPYRVLRDYLTSLRGEFCSAIPSELIKAMLGGEKSQKLLDQARTNEVVDLWRSEDGTECISSHKERLVGKVVKIELRPHLAPCAQLLMIVVENGNNLQRAFSRADWRTKIRENSRFSNSDAKKYVDLLFTTSILRDGSLSAPTVTPEKVIRFIHAAEIIFNPPSQLTH